jgi:hypothetical protein
MRQAELRSVLASASSRLTHEQRGQDRQFSLQNGYHVYSKLKLKALLTDPENTEKAGRYLRIVEVFSKAAERACISFACELLEVQGHVHHFFLPCQTPDIQRLIRFAASLNSIAYEIIQPIAGDGWNGYATTAEFGDSIILATSSGSVISLGPCANNPAKKLHAGVQSGRLTYRDSDSSQWTERQLPQNVRMFILEAADAGPGYEQLARETRQLFETIRPQEIGFARSEAELNSLWSRPVRVQAHFTRADLNGFTALVKEAFSSANKSASVISLVQEIDGVIQEAERALKTFPDRRIIQMPWAGDCVNFVAFGRSKEPFRVTQGRAPAEIGAYWNDSTKLASTRYGWTIGVAGGGPLEKATAAQGSILLARITVGDRLFDIAAGWGVGKSIRAQEAEGARKGDTIVHEADKNLLDSIYQNLFSATETSQFFRAQLTEQVLSKAMVGGLSYSSSKSETPSPKPWSNVVY